MILKNLPNFIKLQLDKYNVGHIQINGIMPSKKTLKLDLEETLKDCIEKKAKGVFLQIKNDQSKIIPIAAQLGFCFHRVNQDDDSLEMLIRFTDHPIPSQFTHTVGGSALVLSPDLKRIFLVQENTAIYPDYWHPPGGKLEKQEFILEGIAREVFEETKIKGDVFGPILFTESYPSVWKGSNLYFLGLMVANSEEFQIDPVELADGRWFTLEDYVAKTYESEFFAWFKSILQHMIEAKMSSVGDVKKMVPFLNYIRENEKSRNNRVGFHVPNFKK